MYAVRSQICRLVYCTVGPFASQLLQVVIHCSQRTPRKALEIVGLVFTEQVHSANGVSALVAACLLHHANTVDDSLYTASCKTVVDWLMVVRLHIVKQSLIGCRSIYYDTHH